jgi:SRSO17 transposase
VFLAYASARGHALIDRELYLPRSWTDETGLDHYQVRTWRAWYAHVTLSMLALAWLAAARAQAAKGEPGPATRA